MGKVKHLFLGIVIALITLSFSFIYSQTESDTTHYSLQVFEQYLDSLDPNDLSTLDKSVTRYHQLFEKSSIITRDTAFIIFWRYYVTVADSLGAMFVQDEKYNSFYNIKDFDESSSKNDRLKKNLLEKNRRLNETDFKILKKVNHYGYKFDIIEGLILVSIADPKFVLKNFTGLISSEMKQYITKVIEEIDTAGGSDTVLSISLDSLVDRLFWWENFIKKNQAFFLIDDCISTYDGYLFTLMLGTDKTPTFNPENLKIKEKFKKIYEKIIRQHKGTQAAEIISKYYNVLAKNNFVVNKEAIDFAFRFLE